MTRIAHPFEYVTRAGQIEDLPASMHTQMAEERDQQLEDYLASLAPTPWTAATLINSWANTAGNEAQYQKVNNDRVFVTGRITTGSAGTVAFVLPSGFRPAFKVWFVVNAASSTPAFVSVDTSGNVKVESGATVSTACHLEQVQFSVSA